MKRILASIICIGIVAFVSCNYENTATVTIDTGIRQQAQLSLFDRVLAFFSLAQPLQADPVPYLVHPVSSIILTISSSDMETITRDVSLDTGKITLEVPAGSQRTFELLVYTPDDLNSDYSTPDRYYGGIATVDLSPGQQVNLNIEMGELPVYNYPSYNTTDNSISIHLYKDYTILSFNIYRTVNGVLTGPIPITNFEYSCDQYGCNYNFIHYLGSDSSEYCGSNAVYISGVNKYGEGDRMMLSNCF